MNRRTLDLLFSAGGILFGALLLVLGLVLNNQANFAKSYVANQLTQQKITFTPAEALRRTGSLCLGWPAPTGVAPQALGRNFPNVPTLVLEGALERFGHLHSVGLYRLPWPQH